MMLGTGEGMAGGVVRMRSRTVVLTLREFTLGFRSNIGGRIEGLLLMRVPYIG